MKKLTSIELFSGAGGLALGLHDAGFSHQALYEWNASAVETLLYNQAMGYPSLKGCTITRADVRSVDFRKHHGVDLVAGGPPCQPFSMGGKAAGMKDVRDMFPQAIRAVAEIQPRAFIFENVRGLLRPAFSNYVEFIRLQMEFPGFPISENISWDQNLARLQRHKERMGDSTE
ncbi:MAG: DNA (cytosine-5-)-methyltransferase, partial [Verrucomicrobiaceae bacterium]